jgi:hypothetical protein
MLICRQAILVEPAVGLEVIQMPAAA